MVWWFVSIRKDPKVMITTQQHAYTRYYTYTRPKLDHHWACWWLAFSCDPHFPKLCLHYSDVTMGMIASEITSLTVVYSTVYSGVDQRKHQSSASLAFVWGIHRGPVNSPHKWPVTRKMLPFDDYLVVDLGRATYTGLKETIGVETTSSPI